MIGSKQNSGSQIHVPIELIERRIYLIRGRKVMIDSDLADLYQVPTKAFNQAVKRNLDRFPEDFMFQLDQEELEDWRSQIVISNPWSFYIFDLSCFGCVARKLIHVVAC